MYLGTLCRRVADRQLIPTKSERLTAARDAGDCLRRNKQAQNKEQRDIGRAQLYGCLDTTQSTLLMTGARRASKSTSKRPQPPKCRNQHRQPLGLSDPDNPRKPRQLQKQAELVDRVLHNVQLNIQSAAGLRHPHRLYAAVRSASTGSNTAGGSRPNTTGSRPTAADNRPHTAGPYSGNLQPITPNQVSATWQVRHLGDTVSAVPAGLRPASAMPYVASRSRQRAPLVSPRHKPVQYVWYRPWRRPSSSPRQRRPLHYAPPVPSSRLPNDPQ